MRRRPMRTLTLSTAATLALAALVGVRAQEPKAEGEAEAYIARPTEEHALLKKDVGVWDAEIKAWMAPDAEPSVSEGTETNNLMGGLWLVSNFRGEFGGIAYRGHGVTGYDTNKKKYVGNWVDTMSSQIIAMEGTYDEGSGTLTMEGKTLDPLSKRELKMKNVVKYESDTSRVMTMYMEMEPGAEPFKMMEITYTKTADSPKAAGKK